MSSSKKVVDSIKVNRLSGFYVTYRRNKAGETKAVIMVSGNQVSIRERNDFLPHVTQSTRDSWKSRPKPYLLHGMRLCQGETGKTERLKLSYWVKSSSSRSSSSSSVGLSICMYVCVEFSFHLIQQVNLNW